MRTLGTLDKIRVRLCRSAATGRGSCSPKKSTGLAGVKSNLPAAESHSSGCASAMTCPRWKKQNSNGKDFNRGTSMALGS